MSKEKILVEKLQTLVESNVHLKEIKFIKEQPEWAVTLEAMQEYADQCVKERNEQLKEWLEGNNNTMKGDYFC